MILKKINKYYYKYTLVFFAVFLLVFCYYFASGRTFIWQSSEVFNGGLDGVSQHYRALVYYAKFLRKIVRTLVFDHQFVIPNWDFAIGEGSDILNTLNYYVIGDPFTFLSVIVPTRFMWIYYGFIIVLKIYLAGLFFSYLCFKTGKKNEYAILAGSITYVFCSWVFSNVNRHPFFLNPMVYFPLIIVGIENVLKKEKPYLLLGTVFLAALSNFYFFYIIVLLTIIYALVRLIIMYKKDIKSIVLELFKIGVVSFVGVLLSSVIFLPICYTFLSDTRMLSGIEMNLIYPMSYYSQLPSIIFSSGFLYWLCMGYSVPTLLAIFLLFLKKKENILLKSLFIISIVLMLIPAFGQILNGFSYMSNRWSWSFALLVAYILVSQWDNLLEIDINEWKKLCICIAVYALICILFAYSKNVEVFISVTVALFTLILIAPFFRDNSALNKAPKVLFGMIIISIAINGYLYNSINGNNYTTQAAEIKDVKQELNENETKAIYKIMRSYNENEKYVRFSGRNLTNNANMSSGLSSTQYYWTISNPYIWDYRCALGVRENINYNYGGYDDRTALNTLSSVKYFVIQDFDEEDDEVDEDYVPYGFKYIDTIDLEENNKELLFQRIKEELNEDELSEEQVKYYNDLVDSKNKNYRIYRNNIPLSFVYSYDNYVLKNDWDKENAIDKQESMLQAVVVDKELNNIDKKEIEKNNVDIPFDIEFDDSEISIIDNKIVVTAPWSTIKLNFDGINNAETYFLIEGLNFEPTSVYDLYFGDDSADPLNLYNKATWDLLRSYRKERIIRDKYYWTKPTGANIVFKDSNEVSKTLNYYTDGHQFYTGRHDFAVNFGYSEIASNSITIAFSERGIYSFDSISIKCQLMDKYVKQVEALKKAKIQDFSIDVDTVNCKIEVEQPRLIVFAIPYSEGWEAFVDGQKAELIQANIKNIGIELNDGVHDIVLKYHTPLLKVGFYISISTLIVFVIGIVLLKKKNKSK